MRSAVVLLASFALFLMAVAARSVRAESAPSGADLFPQIASVLKSPRCQNCHTATGFPRQGDDRHPHHLNVVRGLADRGADGLHCATCHAERNNPASGVPGAPHWGVAPIAQQWETLDGGALCRRLINPNTNGGRSLAVLETHMNNDPLVQWAWHPGNNAAGQPRTLPPVDQQRFHALVHAWIAAGAACPA